MNHKTKLTILTLLSQGQSIEQISTNWTGGVLLASEIRYFVKYKAKEFIFSLMDINSVASDKLENRIKKSKAASLKVALAEEVKRCKRELLVAEKSIIRNDNLLLEDLLGVLA